MVREERLELSHLATLEPRISNTVARHPKFKINYFRKYIENKKDVLKEGVHEWCGKRDLNSHILRYWNLNPARLPIPPFPLIVRESGRDKRI